MLLIYQISGLVKYIHTSIFSIRGGRVTKNSTTTNVPHRALEYQIQELVHRLLDGQGLPLIKPPALRRMSGYEKTRVMVLRMLETVLGVRRPGELKMATDSQILPVVCVCALCAY